MSDDTRSQVPHGCPGGPGAAAGIPTVVLLYASFPALWILLSDKAVERLFTDPAQITLVSTMKGWAFVVVTSLLLYGLMRRLLGSSGVESAPAGFLRPVVLPLAIVAILLVEDEPALVIATKQMLEKLGYEVECRTSGVDALKAFHHQSGENPFDLVITDMTMPQLTAADLARELLRLDPTLPILLCTGFSETMNAEKARSLGIREVLMKPFAVRELAGMIRKVLDERPQ